MMRKGKSKRHFTSMIHNMRKITSGGTDNDEEVTSIATSRIADIFSTKRNVIEPEEVMLEDFPEDGSLTSARVSNYSA